MLVRTLRVAVVLALPIFGLSLNGCVTVNFDSQPQGADTYMNGHFIGRTPFTHTFNLFEASGATGAMVLPGYSLEDCPYLPAGGRAVYTSAPSGALIYKNGRRIGTSPLYDDVGNDIPTSLRAVWPESVRHGSTGIVDRSISCDLRIIAVSDGSGLANASGEAASNKLDVLAKGLAGKLREGMVVKGESIAVVTLRNRSGTRQGKVVADELADKVQGALIDTAWFDVKERIDLRAVLDEKDLDTAGMVKNENVRKKLAGVKYIVIGGVTAMAPQDKP
jgi:hypothetical protein